CATQFYAALAAGRTIGAALLEARHAVRALRSPDWADYLHYGDPLFELKGDGPDRTSVKHSPPRQSS
ncbi:MAG: hypothetical protein KIT78_07230, partial [Steroidobacteraceae bacterium]|nr:hypothetical protein [Steroidobacteraceae bacterium]